jgi:2',3'-cyclic-nucleotide 2'-phosphodiesterase/3'-nucleotidase
VLVGVFHMGLENEYAMPNSGVTDILNACPEFDVMVSSHEHHLIPGTELNGVLVVQNSEQGRSMEVIDLTLKKDGEGWKVIDRASEGIIIADYEADPAMLEMLEGYDLRAREDANQVIGRLEVGALAPETGDDGIPAARLRDTALVDLINDVEMYYAGVDVATTALPLPDANLYPGEIKKCDIARIYSFSNTLYTLRMTGAQLKKFMEWSADFYNTFHSGDKSVTFNENFIPYNFYLFSGVRYEVNLSHEPGSRIEHLTWPDGTPVRDDDAFEIAVNNYCANSLLLVPDVLYTGDDLPTLVEKDVHGEIGGISELIRDYIVNVKGGVIVPECDDSWRLTSCE